MNLVRITLPVLAALALAACATQPAPLQGQYTAITPSQATEQDNTGAVVRWGGRIVEVEPKDNRTCFQVVSTRLNVSGRPYRTDEVGGRFIACRAGFYDPALFEKNREVTFTGRIDGYEVQKIGEYNYRFPHMAADVVYLWPAPEPGDGFGPPMMPFPFYSPYYAPYYPWWGGYPGRW